MKIFSKNSAITVIIILGGVFLVLTQIVGPQIDKRFNAVLKHDTWPVSPTAQTLHDGLFIADLHADTLLWRRDPKKRQKRGHVDLPRLKEGGVDFQIFSAVTKSPRGLNFDKNDANAPDQITLAAQLQLWPTRTWNSIYERAAYQAQRLQKLEKDGALRIIRTADDMEKGDANTLQALLLTEGAHPLEGKIENIARLRAEGYRAMGLQHFFDNELGGSMHGQSRAGLTPFGRDAVLEMRRQGILIDVAHSSSQTVRDVLEITPDPIFISHGGTLKHCPQTANRNLPDDIVQDIAARGGIIGIGYFSGVICDITPNGIAKAIIDAVDLLGPDAVALGSDFDGTVTTHLDTSELAAITEALLQKGASEPVIRGVMGENARRFFLENLPSE